MSDELDPQLVRLFAGAHEPLHDDGFHARVMAHLARPPGWRGIAHAIGSAVCTIGGGLVIGVTAPFRQRMSLGRLLAIGLGAIVSCVALLAA